MNKKQRCPRCASRLRDTRGDNLHVYPDGSTYCFACGYSSSRTKLEKRKEDVRTDVTLPRAWETVPGNFQSWWDSFLPTEPIRKWAYYSPENQRLIFPLPGGWIGRSLDGSPKWIQQGDKKPLLLGNRNRIVLCEDIISGIKSSLIVSSLTLFGTSVDVLDRDCIDRLRNRDVSLWLDSDMKQKMLKHSVLLKSYGIKVNIIYRDRDLKCYSLSQIAAALTAA